jgi:hypothetical protein
MKTHEQETRFDTAVGRFFAAHAEDPRSISYEGEAEPESVVYHRRMRDWLAAIEPDASEALRLAVCCQHIRRWTVTRDSYPEGKLGYKKWRYDLAVFHGETGGEILRESGYGEEIVARVKEILLKTRLKEDPEVQTLEDVICLVFMEIGLAAFVEKHDEEKIGVILRKTWKKMSPRGHEKALELVAKLPQELGAQVVRALG